MAASMTDEEFEEAKYGFKRLAMHSGNLADTVDPYDRHVLLCYKRPEDWLPRVEDFDDDLLPMRLSITLRARKNGIPAKIKLTMCGAGDGTNFSDGDVLIFPDMIKYKALTVPAVEQFVDDVLVNGKPWSMGEQEPLTGSHVFVCAHGSRDKRCGFCGPALVKKFEEEIESRGLKDQVFVKPCSDIGGHKYAGNVIVYTPDSDGKIDGQWYGYVTPDDVSELLDEHIGKKHVVERLWRGRLGYFLVGKHEKHSKEKKHKKHRKGKEEAPASGCCQGVNGVSCCKDGDFAEKKGTSEPKGKQGLCNLPSWAGKWKQRELLAAGAVIGAISTVAITYSFYKRSHA